MANDLQSARLVSDISNGLLRGETGSEREDLVLPIALRCGPYFPLTIPVCFLSRTRRSKTASPVRRGKGKEFEESRRKEEDEGDFPFVQLDAKSIKPQRPRSGMFALQATACACTSH